MEEERRTDPRLLNLILAAMTYIRNKQESENQNPFVEGIGDASTMKEAYEYLLDAVQDCEAFYPEVSEFVKELASINPEENQA